MEVRTVVGDDLRDTADGPRLVGGCCRTCGAVAFPRPASCARCTGSELDEHLLAAEGTLWTYTVQGFQPKAPYDGHADFAPYGVGYVDLAGEVLVESRLTVHEADQLAIGDRMMLVLEHYGDDASGDPLTTFAFAPVEVTE